MIKKYIEKIVNERVDDYMYRWNDDYMHRWKACKKCGGLFDKDKMKRVIFEGTYIVGDDVKYYCRKDAPNYDRMKLFYLLDLPARYYKNNVEVDENGKPKPPRSTKKSSPNA